MIFAVILVICNVGLLNAISFGGEALRCSQSTSVGQSSKRAHDFSLPYVLFKRILIFVETRMRLVRQGHARNCPYSTRISSYIRIHVHKRKCCIFMGFRRLRVDY